MLVAGDIHRSRVILHSTSDLAGSDLLELITSPMHAEVMTASLALACLELGDVLKDLAPKSKDQISKEKEAHKSYQKAAQYGHPEAEDRLDALLLSTASSSVS